MNYQDLSCKEILKRVLASDELCERLDDETQDHRISTKDKCYMILKAFGMLVLAFLGAIILYSALWIGYYLGMPM